MMTDAFLEYLRLERNYSASTVKNYKEALDSLGGYFKNMDGSHTWGTIDSDIVRGWMERLVDEGLKPSTINGMLSGVRSFYRWALRCGLVKHNPAHGLSGSKQRRPLPHFVRDKDMDGILDPQRWGDDYDSVLARTLLIVFYETGVRLSELIGLDDEDVSLISSEVKVTGKRNKQRVIPFGRGMAQVVAAYRGKRDAEVAEKRSGAFFLNKRGRRVSRAQVDKVVKSSLSLVPTLGKRSPHVLRHSFATAMLNHGAGLECVKKLLGHESLATTEIYTHTTFEQLKRVYKHAHPRA